MSDYRKRREERERQARLDAELDAEIDKPIEVEHKEDIRDYLYYAYLTLMISIPLNIILYILSKI